MTKSATVPRQNQAVFNFCFGYQVTRELAMSGGNSYLKFSDIPVMHNSKGPLKNRNSFDAGQ
ncbi:hypothetical Protein YC6258_02825 [Gynuella sunshinyii YC6258]|uniref:Uncharacterized protein n=1 Tax=Gynuella sunshinyii YC6258 TaxID=1445510 RepID=A0A0C5VNB4_9GAMM|nr:hypothetical Protein YC6258_02825 [Gynuella sunshinyii YC6258]